MSQLLVKFINVNKTFNKRRVIKNFNYSFYKGKVYLLKGENGSGKSTIIKLALNLYSPTSGQIIRKFNKYRYVPELLPLKTNVKVKTYLTHLVKLMGYKRDNNLEKMFELELNKPVNTLSKGNLKKVLLYLSFIGSPEVIFLDEPLDGLDENIQKVIINYMQKRSDICYIISSHNQKYYENFKEIKVIYLD